MQRISKIVILWTLIAGIAFSQTSKIRLDERPVQPGEWGYRPEDDRTVGITPPSFVWRATKGVLRWELRVAEKDTDKAILEARIDDFFVHTPSEPFKPGTYTWKYRGIDRDGKPTNWSRSREFTVPEKARSMPLPPREVLLSRIPKEHPRLFVRPEGMDRLRKLARDELHTEYKELVKQCEALLKEPPDVTEPLLYKEGNKWSDELDTWWGNRRKTISVLENAAMLAFVWSLDGNEKYADLSKQLLLAAAEWDPKGSTGFLYNDEAGMPFAYHFSRAYTFLYPRLDERERQKCREIMKIRGGEMYRNLCPKRFWIPYESHSNRAWHFLGEIALAFYGEIPEADDWIWFVMNKFYAAYPVWSDDDGGWHEGVEYWNSYQIRFCWWVDAMRAAFNINAYDKPYYSQIGYYPMYVMPPGKKGGVLGDLNQTIESKKVLELVDILAMQSGNPYWRWYVDAHKADKPANNYYTFNRKYYTFIRKAASLGQVPVTAKVPTDLPPSRLFQGTGLAVLNTTLLDSDDNVQIQFKSAPAPFGNHSHGYDPNNSYVFSAWNENLLINTGRRDYYESPHHRDWMWSCRSENNITVDGVGQLKRSNRSTGEIVRFHSGRLEDGMTYDIVVGEASEGYILEENASKELLEKYPDKRVLNSYRRNIVFLKPDILIVFDRLEAVKPATFEYWLHAKYPFQPLEKYFPKGQSSTSDKEFMKYLKKRFGEVNWWGPDAAALLEPILDFSDIGIRVDKVACRLDLLLPEKLTFAQTNQYDPMPQPKVKVREWHLTAKTPIPKKNVEFLLVAQPWKVLETETVPEPEAKYERKGKDIILRLKSNDKIRTVCFPGDSDDITVRSYDEHSR